MPLIKKAKKAKKSKPQKTRVRRKKIEAPAVVFNPEQHIEESKYYAGPIIQKFEEVGAFELPPSYDDNRIVIMVRDPFWIYAYWEINQKKIEEIKSALGPKFDQSRLVLRVYDAHNWNFFDIQISERIGNWYIKVGRPNTSYCVDIGFLAPDGTFIVAARSNIVTTPREKMSEVIDEEWMIPDWEKMYASSGGFRVGQGSLELSEMMEKRLLRQISSPGVSSLFSPVRPKAARPFWLVANCEAIVYGATEPTAKVTIQGQPIKLREDGTFSVRYALPDGKQVIPIESTRDDGREKRKITPIIERRTE